VIERHSRARNYVAARHDQIDCEGREEHDGERHGLVGQVGGDARQQRIDGSHRQAAHADDDLGQQPGHEPGRKERHDGAHDGQRQILQTHGDQAVAIDRLHLEVHVPEEDSKAHEREQDGH
jgi:hypothetical protein